MNKLIAVLALTVAMINPAMAENPFCDIVLEYAVSIMDSRQSGVPVQKMMAFAEGSDAAGEMIKAMTIDAYNQSRYDSPDLQATVIENFGNRHYLNCVQRSK